MHASPCARAGLPGLLAALLPAAVVIAWIPLYAIIHFGAGAGDLTMRLWRGVFVAPLAFLAELTLAYALVPYACESQRHAPLHAVNAVALAVAVAGALYAWQVYRAAGGEPVGDPGDRTARDRFVGMLGLLLGTIVSLALLAQWITAWMLPPCVR